MRKPFNGTFPLTQGFGENPQIYAQLGMRGHNGHDYGLPCGTPVVAAISGKVFIGWDANGYGNFVFITGGGIEVVNGHLSAIGVNQGVTVQEGQFIGRSGTTGFSTGCHLHFGTRPIPYNNSNGYFGYVDPLTYLQGGNMPFVDQAVIDDYEGWKKMGIFLSNQPAYPAMGGKPGEYLRDPKGIKTVLDDYEQVKQNCQATYEKVPFEVFKKK